MIVTRSPVALDANLAVLFTVGLANIDYIEKHKRLRRYDVAAFRLLDELLGAADGVVWCPHVLTETSNLVLYLNDPIRPEAAAALALLVNRYQEKAIPSAEGCARPEYLRLGLTDAILLTLASTGATLVTDDLDLHLAAASADLPSINFNELRDEVVA